MAGRLSVLVSKELKELVRDPKIVLVMIIVPSIMFVVMGNIVGFAAEKTVEEVMKGVRIAFVDADGKWAGRMLLSVASGAPGASVEVIKPTGGAGGLRELALQLSQTGEYELVIVVPPGFTDNITSGKPAVVQVYSVVRGLSLATGVKPELVRNLLEQYRERLVKNWLKQAFPDRDPDTLLNPFTVETEAVVAGRPLPAEAVAMMLGQSFVLFLGPLILLSIATGLAAASIGVEKEEKTLETLLSLPIERRYILFSKAIATMVVALIGTLSLSAGFLYYMHKVASLPENLASQAPSGPGAAVLGLGDMLELIGPLNLTVALLGVFVSIMLVLLLSIVVSSMASNVREAQAMAGYIWLPLFIPLMLLMFINITSFSTAGQILLALLPFATPLLTLKAVFEGIQWVAYLSLASNLAYNAIVLYVGARWFEGERLLTARLPRVGGARSRGLGGILRRKG